MSDTLTNLNGWYWVEWRGTLEPELFRDGRIQDHDGDWIMPAPTRKIGPRIPEPEELKATELELAKLRNRVDDLYRTLSETQDERDRLQAENAKYLDMIQKMYWTAGLISDGDELEAVKRLREERNRLRAEVERLRPKADGGWRFFDAHDGDFWAVTKNGHGVMFGLDSHWYHSSATLEACLLRGDTELTAHDAYARLAPEGQAKFREITGYEPPTCKESLPVQPEERVRCYLGRDGKLRCYKDREECLFIDNNEDVHLAQPEQLTIDDGHKRITVAEAIGIVRDRPKQIAKLQEMAGIETPKEERVRCYRSNSGGVWVYGVQHNTYFTSYGDWHPAQSESTTLKNGTRCTISEARALLADKPTSLAEFDRITGRDEDREHLARLMAIPCKEMRV